MGTKTKNFRAKGGLIILVFVDSIFLSWKNGNMLYSHFYILLIMIFIQPLAFAGPNECRKDPYIGKAHKSELVLDVPPSKSSFKTLFECKSRGGDMEVARFTLFEGGAGEVAYWGEGDKSSHVCPLRWIKGQNSVFTVDLNTQQHLKLFFNQTEENKKLIRDGKFEFTIDSKFSISITHCERNIQNP